MEKKIQWPPNDGKGNPISVEDWKTHPGNLWKQLPDTFKRVYSNKPFSMDAFKLKDNDQENKVPPKETANKDNR